MMRWIALSLVASSLLACGSNVDSPDDSGGQGGGQTSGSTSGPGGSSSSATGSGGSGATADPNLDGPLGYLELDDSVTVPATGKQVAIHAAYPDAGGPYPVVLVGHGFQLPPSQYYGYLRRLASFGYVALTVDFQAGLLAPDNVANAKELLYGLDWLAAHPTLASVGDVNNVGTTGHSLGGKLALLAATMDDRIRASITLDPVDGAMSCSPTQCPDVSALMPLPIPTAFVGETLDATGSFQACAPAADNFDSFYANTTAPSLRIEVLGANHMSFLDDPSSCGFVCSFCNPATLDDATVGSLSRAFVVAFYERYLKGNTAYDTYLAGAEAQARYVTPGLASVEQK